MNEIECITISIDLHGVASGKLKCDLIVPKGLSDEEVMEFVSESESRIYAPSNLQSFQFQDDECHEIDIHRENGRPLFSDEEGIKGER